MQCCEELFVVWTSVGVEDRQLEAGLLDGSLLEQMGNIGNTLGTPVLATILLGAGYSGMILTAIAVCAAGLGVHSLLARLRR